MRLRLNRGKQAERGESRKKETERRKERAKARSRFCCCHRNSLVGVIRGHSKGDVDGMLLVLMLDQDTRGDAVKTDSATVHTCVKQIVVTSTCLL